jgi:cell division protein FtsA
MLMSNSGGLWDNAKKYIEAGNFGGKGSEAHKAPRNPNETVGTGVVLTAAEKQKAEEEARRKREQEEEEARLLAEKEAEEEAKRRKENSLVHKFMRGFKKFVKDTISEEE